MVSFKRIKLQPGPLFKDCQHSIPQETLSVAMEWLHPYATMKMMCTKIDAVINYIKTNTETLVSCLHTLYDFSVNCHTFNLSPYLSEAYLLCYNIDVLHLTLWQWITQFNVPQESEANLPRLTTALRLIEHLTSQHSVLPHSVALELTSGQDRVAESGIVTSTECPLWGKNSVHKTTIYLYNVLNETAIMFIKQLPYNVYKTGLWNLRC